jgi:GT2 family glycosyltransferase
MSLPHSTVGDVDEFFAIASPRMSMPLVSILLPVRNGATTLNAAVTSMLAQTYRAFELVIINDSSIDDTQAIIDDLTRKDSRVRGLLASGQGLVAALNQGLRSARGPLIARMDSDDESLPRRLEASVRALEEDSTLAGLGTGVEIFRDDHAVSPNLALYGDWLSSLTSPELVLRDRFIESPLCHPSVMLRRSALEGVGAWRDGDFAEDWELWLRLMEAGHRLTCLPERLHRWRDHDLRLTRVDQRYARRRHLELKADFLARRLEGVPTIVWGATDTGRALARLLLSKGTPLEAFVELNPKKLGQRIHGLPVVAPDALGAPNGRHVLSCVGAQGARPRIREHLSSKGYVELRDFTCVA